MYNKFIDCYIGSRSKSMDAIKTDKPVTLARWPNKSFWLASCHRNIILTTTHGWGYLCGNSEIHQGGPNISLEPEVWELMHWRRQGTWFYSCHLSPKVAQLSVKREPLSQQLLQWGKEECSESPASQQCKRLPKTPILSCPNQGTEGISMAK